MTRVWAGGVAVLTGLFVALVSAPADAQLLAAPSIWARAASEKVNREVTAIEAADKALSRDASLRKMNTAFRRAALLRRTLTMLRRADAAKSTNPQLRFRLAQTYYALFGVEPRQTYVEQAAVHFAAVIASDDVPRTLKARALGDIAICYARLGKHAEEVAAYNQAIALQPDPISHSVLLANQAEGLMARARIIDAVRGYRASLRSMPSVLIPEVGVTTMWGLAVALDRSGDLTNAIENVRRARSYDPHDKNLYESGTWFFVPTWDEHWYRALGHWQIARDTKNLEVRVLAYRAAIESWQMFLDRAGVDDPWLRIADHRKGQCEQEQKDAKERLDQERADGKIGEPSKRPWGISPR